jgi:hypothetical protein
LVKKTSRQASLAHCQDKEPKLIKIDKKWYAYHERRRGHLRSKIDEENVFISEVFAVS